MCARKIGLRWYYYPVLIALVVSTASEMNSGQERAKQDPKPASYILGPDDQLSVRVLGAPEIGDKPVRIGLDGNIELTYIGSVRAAGLTLEQLRQELATRFQTVIREPDVAVSIEDFRSQPVSVIGAVVSPGVHQIRGRKTLVEVLSMSGGLRPDAGDSIAITRRSELGPIGLPSEERDPTGQFGRAKVNVKTLMGAKSPQENILIQPNDVISVPRAEMVYVVGGVPKAGGFVLNERESLSILKVLSLAGGLDRTASPQNAKILRATAPNAPKQEIAVNLRKILAGREKDIELHPEDILFIPDSTFKRASVRGIEAAIQAATGVIIWRQR